MTLQSRMDAADWQMLVGLYGDVGVAMALAAESGIEGTLRELDALLVAAEQCRSQFADAPLVQAVLAASLPAEAAPELRLALRVQAVREALTDPAVERDDLWAGILHRAVQQCEAVAALLHQHVSPAEAEQFARFVLYVGGQVAFAAHEQTRSATVAAAVSPDEMLILRQFAAALQVEV